jgi:hypothetical protein
LAVVRAEHRRRKSTLGQRSRIGRTFHKEQNAVPFQQIQNNKILAASGGGSYRREKPRSIELKRRTAMPPTDPFDLQKGFPAWLGAIVGAGAGVVYGLAGFFLLKMSEGPRMGQVLFIMLPFLVGATIAMVTPRGFLSATLLSATISLLICLLSLIAMHAEGILCAVLAFPLIFVPLAFGVAIGTLLRNMIRPFEKVTTNFLVLLAAPCFFLVGIGWRSRHSRKGEYKASQRLCTWRPHLNRCGQISSRG